jgi:pimeloyl-ACP methyl ester carboxylesterase
MRRNGSASGARRRHLLGAFASSIVCAHPMMSEIKEELGERATIVVISNASHALIPEQPAVVIEAIVAWIARIPRQS